MIPITHPNLHELAQKHWEAIKTRNIKAFSKTDFQGVENWFLKKGYTFENVVKAKPTELKEIASKLCYNPVSAKKGKKVYDYEAEIKKFIELYEDFAKSSSNWGTKEERYNAYELVKELGMQVCPYCNRNYIRNLEKIRTCEIDHFYPKEAYPFLAMSFYNLIPSCKSCNQTFKKDKIVSKNPYDFFEKCDFKLKIKNTDYYTNVGGFEIDFSELEDALDENFVRLRIKELYNQHKDVILELIQKQVTYSDDYIDDLFKRYEGTLFKNKEDVLRHIAGNYILEEDFHKRPLSKLTHDIAKDLGLI